MNKFLIVIFLGVSCVYGDDFGIAMPDQLEDSLRKEERNKDDSSFILGDRDNIKLKKGDVKEVHTISGSVGEQEYGKSWKARVLSSGVLAPYTYENNKSQIEIKNSDIFGKIYNKGQKSFSLVYIQDMYSVTDQRGVFQRTFERSTGSVRGGTIHFDMDTYLSKGSLSFLYGLGIGVGYSSGKGSFATDQEQESNATFTLYTIPLDFRLGLDIFDSKYFKCIVLGGPSAMGLYQSRNDLDGADERRRVRQYSFGYFGELKLKASFAIFSQKPIIKNFVGQDMTNMYIDLVARTQSYENFQDEISITGSSIGLGFSFDYL